MKAEEKLIDALLQEHAKAKLEREGELRAIENALDESEVEKEVEKSGWNQGRAVAALLMISVIGFAGWALVGHSKDEVSEANATAISANKSEQQGNEPPIEISRSAFIEEDAFATAPINPSPTEDVDSKLASRVAQPAVRSSSEVLGGMLWYDVTYIEELEDSEEPERPLLPESFDSAGGAVYLKESPSKIELEQQRRKRLKKMLSREQPVYRRPNPASEK